MLHVDSERRSIREEVSCFDSNQALHPPVKLFLLLVDASMTYGKKSKNVLKVNNSVDYYK